MAMALTRIPEASKALANLYIHIKQNQIKASSHTSRALHRMPWQTGDRSVLHLDQINTDMMYKWGLKASMSIKQHRSLNTSKPSRRPNSEVNTPLPDHKACPQNWVRIEKSTVQGEAIFFHWYLNHISIKKYSKSEQNRCCLIFKKQPRQQNLSSFWANMHTPQTTAVQC